VATRRGCAVFQVTLRFKDQPDWAAGEYPTREAAAHAAAELYAASGPTGDSPIGVAVVRTYVGDVAGPSLCVVSPRRGFSDRRGGRARRAPDQPD
jgi:hypothetical protein